MAFVTRFAPSPTGPLHLGHAYSAILAHDMARAAGGHFLLRMEDTDLERCKPEWDTLIQEDLRWLGLSWDGPIHRQAEHIAGYNTRLEAIADKRMSYNQFMTPMLDGLHKLVDQVGQIRFAGLQGHGKSPLRRKRKVKRSS